MFFSVPSNRYRQSQSFPPDGRTRRHNPPPSASLYFLSFGLALSISLIVSPIMSPPEQGIFIPHTWAHRTPHHSPQKRLALGARPRTSSDDNSAKLLILLGLG